jgi:2-methyl-3-hydroxypyridine 5-carboxylic acid dioxygenase
MSKALHAEIAGAGFAGLTAAIALHQRGWTVRVHEISHELRAFGAGIFIWENGLRVLRAVGAYEDVLANAHQAGVYETRRDNILIAEHSFSAAEGPRMLTMTRQHLYAAILNIARKEGIKIVTGSEVIGATPDGVLLTASGNKYHADLVVGADGVRSKVRDSLGLLKERNTYTDGIIRILLPRSPGIGVCNWDHVIDFWTSGPRSLRILYVPCNQSDLYLAMMSPTADKKAASIPLHQDTWIEAFPQLEPILNRATAGGRYDAYETTKLLRWSTGRVAIIGDAAHGMAPTLGQGAGTAMMGALSLAVALSKNPDIETALNSWEELERPLADFTQDISAKLAKERAFSRGEGWTKQTLRAANHVPTGTEHLFRLIS